MIDQEVKDFADKMYVAMTAALRDLSFERLVTIHDNLVDEYEETENPHQESSVSFALTAVGDVLRQKQIARAMN